MIMIKRQLPFMKRTAVLIDTVRENGSPFYATIAAILCIQHNFKDRLNTALTREIATVIGGIFGMVSLPP